MSTPNVGITNNPVIVTKGDPIRVEVRPNGRKGDPGEGVPAGGATGQVLKKASSADFHTEWGDDTEGVQGVTGDGVDNTDPANPVISWPDPSDIGAYPDSNPSGYVDASQAANAAPVQSVNGQTGDVVLGAGDVGAIPTTEKGAASGVATLGADGVVPNPQKRTVLDQTRNIQWLVMPAQPFRAIGTQTFFGGLGFAFMVKVSVAESINVTGVVIECTATGVGATVRLYVYSFGYETGVNSPKVDLLHDCGTVDMSSTTGAKNALVNFTLPAGNYYVVAQLVAGSTPTVRAFQAGSGNPVATVSRYDGPGVITAQETSIPLPSSISGVPSATSVQPIILLVVTP